MADTDGHGARNVNAKTAQPHEGAEQQLCTKSDADFGPSFEELLQTRTNGHGRRNVKAEILQPNESEEQQFCTVPDVDYTDNSLEAELSGYTNEQAVQSNGHAGDDTSVRSATVGNIAGTHPAHGQEKLLDEEKVVYAKHLDSNGTAIASVKSEANYEAALKHDQAVAPRQRKKDTTPQKRAGSHKAKLASGRRAGAGWERSAIRFAPLNVPVQRRLQTFAVLWHTTALAMLLTLFFALCSIPLTWPLLVPYLIYTLIFSNEATDGKLGRRSQWLRSSKFWSLFASYFPARLHRTVELEPFRKYIFGYHPHGIISHGAFAAFATEALGFSDLYPGITNTLLTLDSNFRIPFYRDYALALGLASVSRESIENLLSTGGHDGEGMGRAVTIVVGGARESLDARPRSLRLVLNSRKGFVKLAIRIGADLVPTLAFGENDLYDQVDSDEHPWVHRGQLVVKKILGFTVPLFHARGIFNYDVGLMPYRRPVNVVVGRPIKVVAQGRKDGAVDPEYLDQIHREYVAELMSLWHSHKDTFAKDRDGELEIVE